MQHTHQYTYINDNKKMQKTPQKAQSLVWKRINFETKQNQKNNQKIIQSLPSRQHEQTIAQKRIAQMIQLQEQLEQLEQLQSDDQVEDQSLIYQGKINAKQTYVGGVDVDVGGGNQGDFIKEMQREGIAVEIDDSVCSNVGNCHNNNQSDRQGQHQSVTYSIVQKLKMQDSNPKAWPSPQPLIKKLKILHNSITLFPAQLLQIYKQLQQFSKYIKTLQITIQQIQQKLNKRGHEQEIKEKEKDKQQILQNIIKLKQQRIIHLTQQLQQLKNQNMELNQSIFDIGQKIVQAQLEVQDKVRKIVGEKIKEFKQRREYTDKADSFCRDKDDLDHRSCDISAIRTRNTNHMGQNLFLHGDADKAYDRIHERQPNYIRERTNYSIQKDEGKNSKLDSGRRSQVYEAQSTVNKMIPNLLSNKQIVHSFHDDSYSKNHELDPNPQLQKPGSPLSLQLQAREKSNKKLQKLNINPALQNYGYQLSYAPLEQTSDYLSFSFKPSSPKLTTIKSYPNPSFYHQYHVEDSVKGHNLSLVNSPKNKERVHAIGRGFGQGFSELNKHAISHAAYPKTNGNVRRRDESLHRENGNWHKDYNGKRLDYRGVGKTVQEDKIKGLGQRIDQLRNEIRKQLNSTN